MGTVFRNYLLGKPMRARLINDSLGQGESNILVFHMNGRFYKRMTLAEWNLCAFPFSVNKYPNKEGAE